MMGSRLRRNQTSYAASLRSGAELSCLGGGNLLHSVKVLRNVDFLERLQTVEVFGQCKAPIFSTILHRNGKYSKGA